MDKRIYRVNWNNLFINKNEIIKSFKFKCHFM